MNKVPPKAMLEDSPGAAPVTDKISLREVEELAALLRDDEQVPNPDDMENAAAALEALVRLVDAMRNIEAETTYLSGNPASQVAGVLFASSRALAQFIDDREKKP